MSENRVPVTAMGVYRFKDEKEIEWIYALLQTEAQQRTNIFIGELEAWAIALALQENPPERPQTYDTMLTCLGLAGAAVEEAYINKVENGVFYALLSLRVGNQVHQVDMRPSDAISIALRARCPLLINEKIIGSVREA